MKNYYKLLGVPPGSGKERIKKAYRAKAKKLHPDRSGSQQTAEFLLVKEAYEILMSPSSRNLYNRTFYSRDSDSEPKWNYHDFLKERRDSPQMLAKLICYDLLHDLDDEAVELHEKAVSKGVFSIREHLSREDFMDFVFLLAEAYIERGALVRGFRLLKKAADLEEEKPYFRHFYPEVLEKLASIVRNRLSDDEENTLRIIFLSELVELSYPPREEARLRQLLAELLSAKGLHEEAAGEMFTAYKLAPKLPGLSATIAMLREMGLEQIEDS